MGNSSSAPKISSQDRAILDLKVQRDKLTQYQKRLTLLIADAHSAALTALRSKDQRAARLALQRKKYQETVLTKTDAQLQQLEQLTSEIELAQVQKAVVEGIRRGTGVLAQIRKEMGGVEEVERVMAASEEERARAEEVGDILAGRLGSIEEDEVDEELERMEREVLRLPDAPRTAAEQEEQERLPDVPAQVAAGKVRERSAVPA